jgi:1-acyl-sn-glycerol-3-phosphate acyltransferase
MTLYAVIRRILGPAIRRVWRLEIVGAENVPAGPAVVVANHDSLSDPFFLGAALERPLRFLAKRELWRYTLVGRLLDRLGGIPVERSRGDVGAVASAAQALERGALVAIFPQGTVLGSVDRPWQRGAARLALTTGAPIVPVAIVGAADVLRPRTRIPRLARVRVVIGTPIVVARRTPTISASRELTGLIRDRVDELSTL